MDSLSFGLTLPRCIGAFDNPRLFVWGVVRFALTLGVYQVSNSFPTPLQLCI